MVRLPFIFSIFLFWFGCHITVEGKSSTKYPQEIQTFLKQSRKQFGFKGKRMAKFLVQHMPSYDLKTLKSDYLLTNLEYALKARKEFPWSKKIKCKRFLNDVLPYAILDEPRDPWRRELYDICKPLIKEATTARQAVESINAQLPDIIEVYYSRERKRANQSFIESKEQGKASCTGLSVILVNACRSVGIPARIAGIASWVKTRGNHNWVEVFLDGQWVFLEYNVPGLNTAWFQDRTGLAKKDTLHHAIWATSWKKTGSYFPIVWDLENKEVAAVNVTDNYVQMDKNRNDNFVYVRVLDKKTKKTYSCFCTLRTNHRIDQCGSKRLERYAKINLR